MADNDIIHTAELLKAALPFVDIKTKTTMDLLVKFYELIGCYMNFRKNRLTVSASEYQKVDMETMLTKIRPICNDRERSFVDQILNIFNAKRMMEMYNSYMSMMKTMQEFGGFQSGEGNSTDNFTKNFAGFDLSSIFGGSNSMSGGSSGTDHGFQFGSDSGIDLSSIFGTETEIPKTHNSDTVETFESEPEDDSDTIPKHNSYTSEAETDTSDKNTNTNSNMFNMLKNMIPPEQMGTFENLRMLFNTMSYDDNNKADQNKE